MKNGFESSFVPFEPVKYVGEGAALVFAPHPDDEVIGCGGAIIRHVRNGDPVHVIIVTDGALGDPDLAFRMQSDAEGEQYYNHEKFSGQSFLESDGSTGYRREIAEYIEARKKESRRAGSVLGYGEPDFLGIGDRTLEYGEKYVNLVLEKIVEFSPCVVYAPSLYEMHPDHRALAMIVLEAVRRCESGEPELVMYEVGRPIPSPDLLLDITDIVSIKLDAIKCFKTQLRVNPFDEYAFSLNRFRAYTLPCDVKSAEAYIKVNLEGDKRSVVDLFFSESEFQRKLGLYSDIRSIPLVSVVIRTIGRNILLKKALDAVALQTYPNIEVVIVDAAGDLEIQTYDLSGRFKVRVFTENRPLQRGEAANAGLDNVHGDYIVFLDDDDWIEGSHIARLVEAANGHPGFQAFYSGTRCIDENGEDAGFLFNYQYDRVRLYAENYLPIHSVMFHRTLVYDMGCRFDENLVIYEDWDFWLQVSRHTDFFHVDSISAVYRITGTEDSGVHDLFNAEDGRRIIINKWRDSIPENIFCDLMEYAKDHEKLIELKAREKSRDQMYSEFQARIDQYENMVALLREQQIDKDKTILAMDETINELSRVVTKIHNSAAFRFYKWISAPYRFLRAWKFR